MLPNSNPIQMAFLAAYYAMASPVNTQPDRVQAVIDALKAQLKADNITDAPSVVAEATASLWANGVLNNEVVTKLEKEIQGLTTKGGFTVDKIAEHTIDYLNAKGASQKSGQENFADETVVIDAATIKQVLDHGVEYWSNPCPDGSQAAFCCVVM